MTSSVPAPKSYLRNLLSRRLELIETRLFDRAATNGYGDITPSMARFYAHLAGRPVHMSELARKLSISRQAVHKMALEGTKAGYVEVVPSDLSGRHKIVQFTAKGWAMAHNAANELDAIERELIKQIGQKNLSMLKQILQLPWHEDEAQKKRRAR